jgi:hypothetical protein
LTQSITYTKLFSSYIKRICTGALLCVLLFFASAVSAQSISREYTIKAVFLFNFTQYVDWPRTSFTNGEKVFVIGVLGADPFGKYLEEVVSGEKVKGLPIVIRRYADVKDVKGCHILYINYKESGQLKHILNTLPKQVLTVSDVEGFAREGGMIRFLTEHNKIRLRINLQGVREGDLNISSKLLRLAEIVNP